MKMGHGLKHPLVLHLLFKETGIGLNAMSMEHRFDLGGWHRNFMTFLLIPIFSQTMGILYKPHTFWAETFISAWISNVMQKFNLMQLTDAPSYDSGWTAPC